MRPIKFRAYYFTQNRMMDWDELCIDMDELKYILNNKLSDMSPAMQFTGMYDKTGVEIYVSDIVRFKNEYNCRVVFYENTCTYALEYNDSNGNLDFYRLLATNIKEMEVIGNIYTTPKE